MIKIICAILCMALVLSSPGSDLDAALANIKTNRSLMGLQLEITNRTHVLYHANLGLKDNSKPVKN